jgi:hypothetical protein
MPSAGTRLGPYEIVSSLGTGGRGVSCHRHQAGARCGAESPARSLRRYEKILEESNGSAQVMELVEGPLAERIGTGILKAGLVPKGAYKG